MSRAKLAAIHSSHSGSAILRVVASSDVWFVLIFPSLARL